jgi:SAM-dependent methyltransferase
MTALTQHQREIERNQQSWQRKPLLQTIYADFYRQILRLIDPHLLGRIVELGSGIGNLKSHLPDALCTDLFPNPWLDMVCDGYEMPFANGTVSHLILFDTFHHLQAPRAFLREARRVLPPSGRLILFEPFISLSSFPIYGLFHHEPIGWRRPINLTEHPPRPRRYYAAQGNATRLFFQPESIFGCPGWRIFHAEPRSAFSYLLSGGYSRPSLIPAAWLPGFQRLDACLSRWPRLFAARCLIGLTPA